MGYWHPQNNKHITNYTPDDGPSHFYIEGSAKMSEILVMAQEKWDDTISLSDLSICPMNIHTRCLTYDLYDPGDYDDFLCITRRERLA